MGVRHPFPVELKKQCEHATAILRSSDTVGTNSKVKSALQTIPASLFRKCHGIAIATVAQVSILLGGAKGGAGVVLKHDPKTGEWSMPIGFGLVGGQFGFQFGVAAIDLVFMLMTESSVKAFAVGNVTLGGELGCALGPHGRTAEADIAIRKTSPIFTYSFSRGLLFTMSVEGIGIVQRNDANEKFYGGQYDTMQILTSPMGKVRPREPDGLSSVQNLHEVLKLRARGAETKGSRSEVGRQSSYEPASRGSSDWAQPYGKPATPPPKPSVGPAKSMPDNTGYGASRGAAASTGGWGATSSNTASPYSSTNTSGYGAGASTYKSSYGGASSTGSYGSSSPSTARTTTTGYSYNRSPASTRAYDSYGTTTSTAYGRSGSYSPSTSRDYSTAADDTAYDYNSSRRNTDSSSPYGLYDRYYDDADSGAGQGETEYDYETGTFVPKGTASSGAGASTYDNSYADTDKAEPAAVTLEPPAAASTAPKRPSVPKRPSKLEALYSFEAQQEGDLELKVGDEIILDKTEGDWSFGRNQRTGKYGMFPQNYAQKK